MGAVLALIFWQLALLGRLRCRLLPAVCPRFFLQDMELYDSHAGRLLSRDPGLYGSGPDASQPIPLRYFLPVGILCLLGGK